MTELWIPVPEFPYYVVSSNGKIMNITTGHVYKPHGTHKKKKPNKQYNIVHMQTGGAPITKTWHSVVAQAWLGVRPRGYSINHINHNKLDNHPSNLEYCTVYDNIKKSVSRGYFTYKHAKTAKRIKEEYRAGQTMAVLSRKYKLHLEIVRSIINLRIWDEEGKERNRLMDLNADTWKAVPAMPNYEMNKGGQIRNSRGKILRPCCIKKHSAHLIYRLVHLYHPKTGKAIVKTVHRLMAHTWWGMELNSPKVVRFKNGNKLDCRLENLEICDTIYEAINKQANKKMKTLTIEQARLIRKLRADGLSIREIATFTGTTKSVVYNLLSGKNYKNFI